MFPFKADPETFKASFYQEAQQQWCLKDHLEKSSTSLSFICGNNPASIGAFQSSDSKLKIGDNNRTSTETQI